MSRYTRPYVGASLLRSVTARLPDGRVIAMRLLGGFASDGYKTDYTARPVRWLEIDADPYIGERKRVHHCWRFAGKRLDKAAEHYANNLREMEAIAGVVILDRLDSLIAEGSAGR